MSLLVDNPIFNSPFEEPTLYWDYKEGQPALAEGHRPAGYYLRPGRRGPQLSIFEWTPFPIERLLEQSPRFCGLIFKGQYIKS